MRHLLVFGNSNALNYKVTQVDDLALLLFPRGVLYLGHCSSLYQ